MFAKRRWFQLLALILITGFLLPGSPAELPLGIRPREAPVTLAAPQYGVLFSDDFESGAGSWNLNANWTVKDIGGSSVLDGEGHAWAALNTGQYWSDYTYTVDVKLLKGAAQIMFRLTDDHGRYILGVTPGGLYLRRESPWGKISSNLAINTTGFAYNAWYTISIQADLNRIRVWVGTDLRLDYTDPSLLNLWPLWQGTIGLEVTGADPRVQFDNVEVYGVISPERKWARTGGPIGGLGYDVRFGATTQELYVTDNYSGVFKSSNYGKTWYPGNRGITGRFWPSGDAIPVFALTVDPNDPTIVWAGLKDVKGVFNSVDAGLTWSDVTPDATALPEHNFVFRGFTIMPGNSNIVFATGEIPSEPPDMGMEFDRVGGRVLRTDDGGKTWKSIWKGDNLTRYVIVRPDNHNIIYVSTGIFDREADNSSCKSIPPQRGGVGVLKGVYNGVTYTWTELTNGLADLYIGSLVMHPFNPDILLAGAGNNGCSLDTGNTLTGGVFITEDGGTTWHKTLANEIITSVEFSPSNPMVAYAGARGNFYRSEDGGWSWQRVAGQHGPWGPPGIVAGHPIDILVDPEKPDVLFANNYGGGNVKSETGGATWTLASQGYTGALTFDVEIHPQNPRIVYATAKSGAFRSADGGGSWEGLAYPASFFVETYSIALKPDNPQVVIASEELGGRIYRSTNGGFSWSQVHALATGGADNRHGLKRIVFAPSNPEVVYGGSCIYHVDLNGNPSATSYGVVKSTNGGVTWQPANDAQTADTCVNNLAVHPTNPNVVYAATAAEGLYKTTNGGQSWTQLSGLPADIRSVAIHPGNPNILYAGARGSGVYRSEDGGATWNPVLAGMEPNDSIWALVFDPANPQIVYAGSFHTGVYQWIPDEQMWTHINLGLRTRAVTDLTISADGSLLYAATFGEGVFRLGEVPPWKIQLPVIVR